MTAKECLKNIRYKLGLTQQEFADEVLFISKGSYGLYEAGHRRPSMKSIRHIVGKLKEKGIQIEYSDLQDKK